jgi:N-acyl-D-amino-acid deacylase
MKLHFLAFASLLLGAASGLAFAADVPFDLVLANGHIVDGTGSPWYAGDIGIRDGRVAAIGNLAGAAARRRIDVAGKVGSSTCWGSPS